MFELGGSRVHSVAGLLNQTTTLSRLYLCAEAGSLGAVGWKEIEEETKQSWH